MLVVFYNLIWRGNTVILCLQELQLSCPGGNRRGGFVLGVAVLGVIVLGVIAQGVVVLGEFSSGYLS